MIITKHQIYRNPSVLSATEIISCKKQIKKDIISYITSTGKSFTVKDLYGYDEWDWSIMHPAIQCIYDEWYKHYQTFGMYTNTECAEMSFKQAAISLGHLVKQAANELQNYKFKISNHSGWNIVYKVV